MGQLKAMPNWMSSDVTVSCLSKIISKIFLNAVDGASFSFSKLGRLVEASGALFSSCSSVLIWLLFVITPQKSRLKNVKSNVMKTLKQRILPKKIEHTDYMKALLQVWDSVVRP